MRTKFCVLFLLIATLRPVVYSKSHSSSSGSKPVHVDGYYRKDGTYVQPHDRSLPGYVRHSEYTRCNPPAYHPPRTSIETTAYRAPVPQRLPDDGFTPHTTVKRDS